MRWLHHPQPPAEVAGLSDAAGISPVLAELLLRVGVARAADAAVFLEPKLADVADPFLIPGMEAAAARLAAALERREEIVVLGDYDVDGVSSAAMLSLFLRAVGSACAVHIPDRLTEGYGPSLKAVEGLKAQGCKVLVDRKSVV